jgi:phosphoglycolate phosphatase-like HAD superfamily hydrolase
MRILIFDNDGTLMPSHEVANPAIKAAFAQFCKEKGIEAPIPTDARICELTGQPGEAFYRALLPPEWKHLSAELRSRSLDEEVLSIARAGRFYPGIREMLAALKGRGDRLAVATNGGARYIGAVASRLAYAEIFDSVYYHGLDGIGSKGEMAVRALRELGPAPAIMIGDRRSDWEAAVAASIPFIGCRYGYGGDGELEAVGRIADTPEDLARILLEG